MNALIVFAGLLIFAVLFYAVMYGWCYMEWKKEQAGQLSFPAVDASLLEKS